jgi:hypothetical protein
MAHGARRGGWISQLLSTVGLLALVMALVVLFTGWVSRLWGPPLGLAVAGACFWAAGRLAGRRA